METLLKHEKLVETLLKLRADLTPSSVDLCVQNSSTRLVRKSAPVLLKQKLQVEASSSLHGQRKRHPLPRATKAYRSALDRAQGVRTIVDVSCTPEELSSKMEEQ